MSGHLMIQVNFENSDLKIIEAIWKRPKTNATMRRDITVASLARCQLLAQ